MNDKGFSTQDLETIQSGYLGVTPPQSKLPTKGQRLWVDRPDQLRHAVDILRPARVVAIDAEFTQMRPRAQSDIVSTSPRLALLQLAIASSCFVVDALRLNDLSSLAAILENPDVTILLHGAGADLRVMAERGLNIAHYYDLEATSRSLFGQQESSLAAMLLRAFNVRMDKSLQRTDWTRRPLPPAMVAYAARDAEMTLALYYWLNQHYSWALQIHEGPNQVEPLAAWIEPYLWGTATVPVEVAVEEAKKQGTIASQEQIYADCRAALAVVTHPHRRSRLLRLIADLSLIEMVPEIEPMLHAQTAEERAAAIRALSRLKGAQKSRELIQPLLQDPVQDVRKAAQTALRSIGKEPRHSRIPPTTSTDGARTWTVGETNDTSSPDGKDDWKSRLRSLMDS